MEALDLELFRAVRELKAAWQCRVLAGSRGHSRSIVASILAHNFDGAILTIMQTTFPGFERQQPPFLCSAGRIDKQGYVIADVWEASDRISRNQVIYVNDIAYRDAMRKVADKAKLTDQERLEFFTCVKRWLVADLRLDPTMDPTDPDAKRLVH